MCVSTQLIGTGSAGIRAKREGEARRMRSSLVWSSRWFVHCLAFLALAGCQTLRDPDTLTLRELREALSASRPSEPLASFIADNFYDYQQYGDTALFGPPVRTEHKVYVGFLMATHPLQFVYSVSRRTGDALVLTKSPGNFGLLLKREGFSIDGERTADAIMREGIVLTGNHLAGFVLLDGLEDLPRGEDMLIAMTPEHQEALRGTVAPLVVSPEAPGAYVGVAYVVEGAMLIRRTAKLTSDAEFSYEDRIVADLASGEVDEATLITQ
jgi:hypothetical protein